MYRPPSRALTALANCMQGLGLYATFEAIKEEDTVLLKEIDAQIRASADDYGMPSGTLPVSQGIWTVSNGFSFRFLHQRRIIAIVDLPVNTSVN